MTDPLSTSAGIIAIIQLTGTVVQYLNDVARASNDRHRILLEITSISGILTVLKDLAERPQWDDVWSTTMKSLNVPNGPLEQFRSALERLALKLEPVRGLKRVERSLAWPFQKREIDEILGAMERQKTLFNLALQNDHTRLSQAIRLDVEGLNNQVGEVSQKLAQVQIGQNIQERRHQDEESQTALAWLSPLNFLAQQSDIIDRRQDGTGQWLLESEEFKGWLDGTRQTLFCPGIPGAGKTVLASIVIHHLSSNMRGRNIGLAYMFCNYRNQLEQTPINLLASLVRQLIPEGDAALGDLKSMYQSHTFKETRPTLDEVSKLLLSAMASYSQVFIVVDALDECADGNGMRNSILAKLRSLQASNDINLMATSRFIPHIMEAFENDPQLEIRASEADVRRYLDGQMFRLARCVIKNAALQEDIKEEIVKAVDGMFLLAQLHLDSLTDKMSIKDVKTALKRLPKGGDALQRAYGNAMERINAQQPGFRELAKQVLSWITYAKRPLTLIELQHALAVELEEPCLDLDNLKDEADMISVCAGLVTVEQESSHIQLVHYTTQEYLEGIYLKSDPDIRKGIAATCLTYLSYDAFQCGYRATDEMFEILLSQNPLLDYAAKHWVHYIPRNTDEPEAEDIKALALKLLRNDNNLSVCAQVFFTSLNSRYRRQGYSQRAPKVSGIHLCALSGLGDLTMTLLEGMSTADLLDSEGRTPLSWAAQWGHEAVVKLLVERDDVEAESKDKYGWRPLSHAARGGHEAVVKLLVERDDVEADSKDDRGQTPLFFAAWGGQEAVVKLLVERDDVEADSKDEDGWTPLSHAALGGHEAVVKLLAERDDVEADSKDMLGVTPLTRAAQEGHEAVVKLLVERDDVEADSKDMWGVTPLTSAAQRGHEAVVKLLVERDDVEADSKDDSGQTPLSFAVWGGHEAVVKLLVEREDVKADSKDDRGQTPLSLAAQKGQEGVMKLLVETASRAR
ncbi:MAG: hypothetical protein M1837_006225 [Sclerophora amabilis]|nr:MAG: hypothetical protein M1837_006225 [Sclerophora amabilis]